MSKLLVHKFSGAMEMMKLVDDDGSMKEELLNDQLFMEEVQDIIGNTVPGIPHAGLASGAMTVGKHIYVHKHKVKNEFVPKFKKPDMANDGDHGSDSPDI